jgi:hypothetical protein
MKVFHCGHCGQLVFFENSACVSCWRTLAYLPDRTEMGTLEPLVGDQWRVLSTGEKGPTYRLCLNGCDRAGARDYAAFLGFFSLEPS